ncbi:hypothetical protein LV457_19145 [Mycobacterium sp. MYCO198283]|uniref:hypothetical protein n=1 Tax=Mycobacterium sp. MYCO198283 TaxID=2883505 RepID=UPI001E4B426D|nr:hypothetical protein [Mycobacterium sp. MYCO198283]MCG5434392.1 hypothetical protein [Mycobacterium sp. MYCO198283]
MDRPDTIIEIHREQVEAQAADEYSGGTYREDVGGLGYSATATLHLELSRVWFVSDSAGRHWREERDGDEREPQRHFAIELAIRDSKIIIDSVTCFPLLPLPPRTVTIPNGPRAGEKRRIGYNEIPLFGRLTIHDQLECRDVRDGKQTIVLDFGAQPSPPLVSEPVSGQHPPQLHGADVERRPDGVTVFHGDDPRVTWDLDYAEAYWITHSIAGELLVAAEQLRHPGMPDAEARLAVLDSFAAQIADAVAPVVAQLGDDGVLDLLPEPVDIDPDADDDTTFKALDARVQQFVSADGETHESMVVELKTIRQLPVGEDLPASVLADRPGERAGLAVTGYSILREVRDTVMNTFGLNEIDFDPDVPCLLIAPKTVEIGGAERTLVSLEADIVPRTGDGRLVIDGRVSADTAMYDFDASFTVSYSMVLDAIPRDAEPSERRSETGETLEDLQRCLADASLQRRQGVRSGDEYEAEVNRVNRVMRTLPRTVGVQPVAEGEPAVDADFRLTTAGKAATAVGAAATAGLLALPATWIAGAAGISALTAGGVLGAAIVEYLGIVVGLGWAGSGIGSRQVQQALGNQPDGTLLPTLGIPVIADLDRQRLAVYFRQVPQRLPVTFVRKDSETGEVVMVGGPWPTDGTPYVMSHDDAALLLDAGALELVVKHGNSAGLPVRVMPGPRGRRVLVTEPDSPGERAVELADLPEE